MRAHGWSGDAVVTLSAFSAHNINADTLRGWTLYGEAMDSYIRSTSDTATNSSARSQAPHNTHTATANMLTNAKKIF